LKKKCLAIRFSQGMRSVGKCNAAQPHKFRENSYSASHKPSHGSEPQTAIGYQAYLRFSGM